MIVSPDIMPRPLVEVSFCLLGNQERKGVKTRLAKDSSLSLAISFPTILLGLFRYARRGRLTELRNEMPLLGFMAVGSIIGALVGSFLVSYVSTALLEMLLGIVLLLSAIKLARERPHHAMPVRAGSATLTRPSNGE